MKNIKRHGDLVFYPIKMSDFKGEKVTHVGSFVLAEGETTGHKHVITATRMEILKDTNGYYLANVPNGAEMSHEEHGTITLEPMIYRVGHEKEKDWFTLAVRKVVD